VPETKIGQMIAREGERYDYLLTPRFYNYPTINFLAFSQKERVKCLVMPEDFAPFKNDGTRGMVYVLMKEHEGVVNLLRNLYPSGQLTQEKDLESNVIVNYYTIPVDGIRAARGISGSVDGQTNHWPDFPKGLPMGAHHFSINGYLFVDKADRYSFSAKQTDVKWIVAGTLLASGQKIDLAKGFYAFKADWHSVSGDTNPRLSMTLASGPNVLLDVKNLTTLPLNHGLKGTWYRAPDENAAPAMVEWSPVINFPHGGDFNFPYDQMCVRWEGILHAPETGEYLFNAKTEEFGALTIDGKKVFDGVRFPSGQIYLTSGSHTIKFKFRKQLGPILTLNWKTPKSNNSLPIPMEAFGETHPGL
jgi:hypothetical protein